jgi:hypothetical protein
MMTPTLTVLAALLAACSPGAPQGPAYAPAPQAPQVYYQPQPYASPQPLAYYVASPVASDWHLSVAGAKLQLDAADGMRSTCEGLTILVPGAPPAAVAVSGREIRVTSGAEGADHLTATALRVTRGGPAGALVTLEGSAHLVCVRQGKRAEITAERIAVNLATGQIQSEMGPAAVPQPPAPSPAPPPVVPASTCPAPATPAIPYSTPSYSSGPVAPSP